MKDEKTLQDELQIKQKRNKELIDKINTLDSQLETKRSQLSTIEHKLAARQYEFDAIKQSKLWTFLRYMKRFLRTAIAYMTGRRHVKQLISKSWKRKQAAKRIKKLTYNLYEQGFEKKALEDLNHVCETADNRILKRQAAWELALWHANKYSKEDAQKALDYIDKAVKGEKAEKMLRRAAILKAESYDILEQQEKGKRIIHDRLNVNKHADLYLAAANLETETAERIKWINQTFDLYRMSHVLLADNDAQKAYDRLQTKQTNESHQNVPKVTVIIPVYNAADGIQTALDAVLSQTWQNLEVLVVDDRSTDHTTDIVRAYEAQDDRVTLLQTETNSGPYVARNIALKAATGDFVTINDADDWSHAEKIEAQATHLVENEQVIANTSQQARLTEDLKFFRRGKPGEYMFANMSSLMFRRKPVMEKLGFWDSVRFGADGEFKRRLKQVFGEQHVVDLKTGPYSFQRQSESSLTGNHVFGYHGFFMGARKEYAESYTTYHRQADTLYYPYPMTKRPFPVPEPMLPEQEPKTDERRHFDVVIASEFRLLGGTNMSNIEEIKAQKKMGLRTGLVQMNRYDFHSRKEINPNVRELIDGESVQMLVYGEKITCDVLIVRHPPILQEWQKYIPDIEAKSVRVIINQPPKRDYSQTGTTLYDIKQCAEHLESYVGKKGKWYPIGPKIRNTLQEHHARELKAIPLSHEDWVNIIDVEQWKRQKRPSHDKIRIGRHSRDQYVKWPNDKAHLLAIYPDAPEYEIHVLGGAKAPEKVLGELPTNWYVHEFGEMAPKDFLATLDVFVYYTHPDWVEAFGRVIFEAMAAGIPVIIPPSYQNLFGEAAIYAEPQEVRNKIDQLMADDEQYHEQVVKALDYVEKHFGYTRHAERLADCFVDIDYSD